MRMSMIWSMRRWNSTTPNLRASMHDTSIADSPYPTTGMRSRLRASSIAGSCTEPSTNTS